MSKFQRVYQSRGKPENFNDGLNAIKHKQSRRWWHLLLDQFSSIVVWLLGICRPRFFFYAKPNSEAIAILVVFDSNAAIGFAIEWQAGRALDALKKATRMTARCGATEPNIIDEKIWRRAMSYLFSAGDRVPADARIYESANLRADESTLTGESVPVEKNPATVHSRAACRTAFDALSHTTITGGNANGMVITATGEQTELGRIGHMVAEVR